MPASPPPRPRGSGLGQTRPQRPGGERDLDPALALDLLEQSPGLCAKTVRQRLEAAGAGGGIVDHSEVGFVDQHALDVTGKAARRRVRKPERQRHRQHGDRIRPAETCGEGRGGRTHHIGPGIALGHHPPGGLGVEAQRGRRKPARRLDPRPEPAHCPNLGEADEHVRVERQQHRDLFARGVEGQARLLQRAEVGDTCRQNGGKFQSLSGAGLVPGPAIREKRPCLPSPALPRDGRKDRSADHVEIDRHAKRARATPIGSKPMSTSECRAGQSCARATRAHESGTAIVLLCLGAGIEPQI